MEHIAGGILLALGILGGILFLCEVILDAPRTLHDPNLAVKAGIRAGKRWGQRFRWIKSKLA